MTTRREFLQLSAVMAGFIAVCPGAAFKAEASTIPPMADEYFVGFKMPPAYGWLEDEDAIHAESMERLGRLAREYIPAPFSAINFFAIRPINGDASDPLGQYGYYCASYAGGRKKPRRLHAIIQDFIKDNAIASCQAQWIGRSMICRSEKF